MAGPIELVGAIRTSGDRVTVELDAESLSNMDSVLIDGTEVRILLWPEPKGGEQLEIDRIAQEQQLERSTVAQALTSEGALWQEREEFLKRLSLIEL